MALSLNIRATVENATDGNNPSVTTGSFTPSDSSLLVAVALSQNLDVGADGVLSITGGSLTWTSRANVTGAGDLSMIGRIWTAPVTTGVSMTAQVTGSNTFGAVALAVVDLTGYNVADPIGATLAAHTGSRSGAYSPALSGTSAADSIVIAGGVGDFGTATKGAAWTDVYDYQSTTGFTQHDGNIESIAGAVSAANWAALDSGFSTAAVAVEIKAAADEEVITVLQNPGVVLRRPRLVIPSGSFKSGAPHVLLQRKQLAGRHPASSVHILQDPPRSYRGNRYPDLRRGL